MRQATFILLWLTIVVAVGALCAALHVGSAAAMLAGMTAGGATSLAFSYLHHRRRRPR